MHRIEKLAADFQLVIWERLTSTWINGDIAMNMIMTFRVEWLRHQKANTHNQHRITMRGVSPEFIGW